MARLFTPLPPLNGRPLREDLFCGFLYILCGADLQLDVNAWIVLPGGHSRVFRFPLHDQKEILINNNNIIRGSFTNHLLIKNKIIILFFFLLFILYSVEINKQNGMKALISFHIVLNICFFPYFLMSQTISVNIAGNVFSSKP